MPPVDVTYFYKTTFAGSLLDLESVSALPPQRNTFSVASNFYRGLQLKVEFAIL